MQIPGSGFTQSGIRLFHGVIKTKDLVARLEEGLWASDIYKSAANPEGYQRALSEARAREFGRFVLRHGICPLSILVNFRDGSVEEQKGQLVLPDGRAFIVDGQHRAGGLRFAMEQDSSVGDFEVPLVIMNVPDQYEEAKQFVIINRSAKGVRADLAERFISRFARQEGRSKLLDEAGSGVLRSVLKGAEWKDRAIEVADILNADKDSVWYRKIRQPNDPRNGSVVAQKSFTDSLEPILKDTFFQGKDAKTIGAALRNYWNAIANLCEAAFEEPQEYVLQKTSGVGALHKVFTRVSEICTDSKGNRVLTQDMFREKLSDLPQMDSSYWDSKKGEAGRRGTGRKQVGNLAMEFLEALEEKLAKSERKEQGIVV
ncbi:MAG: DGQHR domain-containing protein [Chloroflexota bacterium]|nr:DGQHR domain-containing protein [Chloroflexota bacterium]